MTDERAKKLTHQHPTLIQVADWLENKRFYYEADTVREACLTIGSLAAEADKAKRIASKAINEGVADREDYEARIEDLQMRLGQSIKEYQYLLMKHEPEKAAGQASKAMGED